VCVCVCVCVRVCAYRTAAAGPVCVMVVFSVFSVSASSEIGTGRRLALSHRSIHSCHNHNNNDNYISININIIARMRATESSQVYSTSDKRACPLFDFFLFLYDRHRISIGFTGVVLTVWCLRSHRIYNVIRIN